MLGLSLVVDVTIFALLESKNIVAAATPRQWISAVSWAAPNVDVFAISSDGSIAHKYNRGHGWEPTKGYEILHGNAADGLTAISWGVGRFDYFYEAAAQNETCHGYFAGGSWYHECFDTGYASLSAPAVNSWSEGRIDVVHLGENNEGREPEQFQHFYWDGSSWQPAYDAWEDLGGLFGSKPAIVSWAKNRLDIFGIVPSDAFPAGIILHKYWDGSNWYGWDQLGNKTFVGNPSASSWGANRFDVWALDSEGALWHLYWDGNGYSAWESLGEKFAAVPQVVHWSEKRIDIVGRHVNGTYLYTFWDGDQWRPSFGHWYSWMGVHASEPAMVTTGPNSLTIFAADGIARKQHLKVLTWNGKEWSCWDDLGVLP